MRYVEVQNERLKLATKYVQRAFHVKTIDKASKSLQKDIAELSQKLNSLASRRRNLIDSRTVIINEEAALKYIYRVI